MEQNTHRLLWAASLLALGALLIGGGIVLAKEDFLPKISQAFVKMLDGKDKINPVSIPFKIVMSKIKLLNYLVL